MRLDEADKLLADLARKCEFATQNLIEFGEQPICKRLRGEAGWEKPELTGGSRDLVGAALAAIDRMWERMALLNDELKRAQRVRESIWMLNADSKLYELEKMLLEPSITLPPIVTPFAHRSLISAAQTVKRVSLDDLFSSLAVDFEAAKSVVLAVDKIWNEGADALARLKREMDALAAQANDLGLDEARRAAARFDEKLAALSAHIQHDPLAVDAALEKQLRPEIKNVRARIDALLREREPVRAELIKAERLLNELQNVRAQNESAHAECALKIENATGLRAPLNTHTIADLFAWLEKLRTQFAHDFRPLRVALAKFNETVERHLASEQKALVGNRAPVELRAELKGRLSALQAKVRALAVRGTLVPTVVNQIALDAERALQCRPTPLDTATRLVRDFEAKLAEFLKPGA